MRTFFLFLVVVVSILITVGWLWVKRQPMGAMPTIEASEMDNKPIEQLTLSDEEWRKRLSKEQYAVLREGKTERAFTGKYWDTKESGIYVCAGCALPLFSSAAKYDSGTGWPSFWEPIAPRHLIMRDDYLLFLKRVELLCARCEGHLGHVFGDGPPPTSQRYCINSTALQFVPK